MNDDGLLSLDGSYGTAQIEPLPDGRYRVSVRPKYGLFVQYRTCVTAYPVALIREIHAVKDVYTCDEIKREEDPDYVERYLRREVLAYVEPEDFAGKRLLDFGCGSGASMIVLSRLLPLCEIVGIDLDERLLHLARLRIEHYGRPGLRLTRSPAADALPEGLGTFDHVMFNAVFEHLLPEERRILLPKVWAHLRRGGLLFLNQTPYRYSPFEEHTTGLPLINYLPDRLALHAARHLSKRIPSDADWEELLRSGIRGGTVPEVLGILSGVGRPVLLDPLERGGDRIDLWHATLSERHAAFKRLIWAGLKLLKRVTGVQITPSLSLAIRKEI